MSTLIYIIDAPSMEEALHTTRDLEQTTGINPTIMRDLGITYKYDSDAVSEILDGDKSLTEYLIKNMIE